VGFRDARGFTVQRGQGGGDRIGGVGLAPPAPGLAIGADHLHHRDIVAGQVPGQTSAVTAGAFHADAFQLAVGAHPCQRRPVAGLGGGEGLAAQHSPHLVDDSSNMDLAVRVHASSDRPMLFCDAEQTVSFLVNGVGDVATRFQTARTGHF
jgi:hypothetical protein